MREKKTINISLTAVFLIIAIIVIIVMGMYIYKLHIENNIAKEKEANLTEEISTLESKVNNLQGKIDSISNTINSNNENTVKGQEVIEKDSNIKKIEGEYFPNLEGPNDASYYKFYSDGTVELAGNDILKGTYTIENDKIKIKFTKIEGIDIENENIDKDDQLKIIDEETLFDEEYNLKYIKN